MVEVDKISTSKDQLCGDQRPALLGSAIPLKNVTGDSGSSRVELFTLSVLVFSQGALIVPYGRFIGILIACLVLALVRRPSTARFRLSANPWFICLIGWAFLSATWAVETSIALLEAGYAAVVCGCVVVYARRLPPMLFWEAVARGLKWLVGASALVEALRILGFPLGTLEHGGVQGVTSNPNLLAFLCIMYFVLVAAIPKLTARSRLGSVLWLGLAGFLVWASSADAGPIYLVFGIVLLGLVRTSLRRSSVWLYVILCLAFISVLFSFTSFRGVISSWLGVESNPTLSGRIVLWDAAQSAIADRPFFGHGLGSFRNVDLVTNTDILAAWDYVGGDSFQSHNGYLESLLQFGLVGAILIIAAVIVSVKSALMFVPADAALRLSLIGTLLAYNLTEVRFVAPPIAWVLVCALFAAIPGPRFQGGVTADNIAPCASRSRDAISSRSRHSNSAAAKALDQQSSIG